MKKEKNDWSCLEDVPSIADDFDAKAARQACHCMFICFESILKAFEPWIRLIWVSVYCICTLVHSKFGRHQMRGIHFQFIQISVIDKLAVFGYLVRWLAVCLCMHCSFLKRFSARTLILLRSYSFDRWFIYFKWWVESKCPVIDMKLKMRWPFAFKMWCIEMHYLCMQLLLARRIDRAHSFQCANQLQCQQSIATVRDSFSTDHKRANKNSKCRCVPPSIYWK